MAGIANYWLATYWLVDYVGWSLFWRAAALGAGAGAGAGAVVGVGVIAGVNNAAIVLFVPFLALGILMRGFIIRLYATMRHPLASLTQLPQNWRETLLVIDCAHPPELLPQAGIIDPILSVKKIWADRDAEKGIDRLLMLILIAIWYLPP